jgi:hypothetical protein
VFLQFGEVGVVALAPLLTTGLRFDLPWICICRERERERFEVLEREIQ